MPCSRTHAIVGATAGTGAAWHYARKEESRAMTLELLGGALAGALSGCWPDRIEPAFCPHHRGVGHSVLPNALVWYPYLTQVPKLQDALRDYSIQLSAKATFEPSQGWALVERLLAALLRIAAGAVAGIPAGYVSHVALDAFTPMGIPMVGLQTSKP